MAVELLFYTNPEVVQMTKKENEVVQPSVFDGQLFTTRMQLVKLFRKSFDHVCTWQPQENRNMNTILKFVISVSLWIKLTYRLRCQRQREASRST